MKRDETDDLFIDRAPYFTFGESLISKESAIFLWRVNTGKPRQAFIECFPMNGGNTVHLIKNQTLQLKNQARTPIKLLKLPPQHDLKRLQSAARSIG